MESDLPSARKLALKNLVGLGWLRIVVVDGRTFEGFLWVIDGEMNVILLETVETAKINGADQERMLGMVMIGGKHIVSVEAGKKTWSEAVTRGKEEFEELERDRLNGGKKSLPSWERMAQRIVCD